MTAPGWQKLKSDNAVKLMCVVFFAEGWPNREER